MDQDADTLVWPPSDEELDALVALPLHPAGSDPVTPSGPLGAPLGAAAPFAAAASPLLRAGVGPHPPGSLPLRVAHPPVDLLHGLAEFADRPIAGDVILHRPPDGAPRAGAWALAAAGLALASYAAYLLAAQLW